MKTIKFYTKDEIEQIKNLGNKPSIVEFQELAEKLGRASGHTIAQKYYAIKKATKVVPKVKLFNNYNGNGKQIARDKICSYICNNHYPGDLVVSLPASKWLIEKELLKRKSTFKFIGVEKDKKTFLEMLDTLNKDKLLSSAIQTLHYGKIEDIITSQLDLKKEFAHIILDYCGTIDSAYYTLRYIMEYDKVKVNGITALTVTKINRGLSNESHISNQIISNIGNMSLYTDSEYSTRFLIDHLLYDNLRYKLEEVYEYKDSKQGFPMIVFIIKRIS